MARKLPHLLSTIAAAKLPICMSETGANKADAEGSQEKRSDGAAHRWNSLQLDCLRAEGR